MDFESLKNKILNNNYTDFFEDFCVEFEKNINELKEQIIDIGEEYYRARVGNDTLEAAIDDLDVLSDIPYFGSNIEAPPARFVCGGRFNREGISYLYLADNIDTCIAEIHLQVGQVCSIAKFKCVETGKYILVEKQDESNEIAKLYDILTKPVHSGMREYYLITQFFADVFKKLGYDGMIFSSTQGDGKNVVCFKKDFFKLVKYSEKMYKAKKISYDYEVVDDGYKKYKDYRKLLVFGNISEDEKRESKYQYIEDKIKYEDEKNFEDAKKKFDISNDVDEFIESMRKTTYVQKNYEYIGAFNLNRGNLEEGVKGFFDGLASFTTPCLKGVMKRIESCQWVTHKENYKDAHVIEEMEKIYLKLEENHKRLINDMMETIYKISE